jgi:hypothetical protein
MRRQRKTRLSDTELRAMGLTSGLVIRKVRSADSPAARKKFTCGLTIQDDFTNNDEFRRQNRGGEGV